MEFHTCKVLERHSSLPVPRFSAERVISSPTTDAATELQVSNSKLMQVETAFTAQRSEVLVPGATGTIVINTLSTVVLSYSHSIKGGLNSYSHFSKGGLNSYSHFSKGGLNSYSHFSKGDLNSYSHFSKGGLNSYSHLNE